MHGLRHGGDDRRGLHHPLAVGEVVLLEVAAAIAGCFGIGDVLGQQALTGLMPAHLVGQGRKDWHVHEAHGPNSRNRCNWAILAG